MTKSGNQVIRFLYRMDLNIHSEFFYIPTSLFLLHWMADEERQMCRLQYLHILMPHIVTSNCLSLHGHLYSSKYGKNATLNYSTDLIPLLSALGQWSISCKSRIFQFQTEAVLRLGLARQKKGFNQGSKESHSFMLFVRDHILLQCGRAISIWPFQSWSLVLTRRLLKQKTSWVERSWSRTRCNISLHQICPSKACYQRVTNILIFKYISKYFNILLHHICPSSISKSHEKGQSKVESDTYSEVQIYFNIFQLEV